MCRVLLCILLFRFSFFILLLFRGVFALLNRTKINQYAVNVFTIDLLSLLNWEFLFVFGFDDRLRLSGSTHKPPIEIATVSQAAMRHQNVWAKNQVNISNNRISMQWDQWSSFRQSVSGQVKCTCALHKMLGKWIGNVRRGIKVKKKKIRKIKVDENS